MNLLAFRASTLISSWIKNVVKRFESLESNGVLLPFDIFDPVFLVSGTDDAIVSKRMKKRIISSAPYRRGSKYQVTVLVEPNKVAHNRILKAEMQE